MAARVDGGEDGGWQAGPEVDGGKQEGRDERDGGEEGMRSARPTRAHLASTAAGTHICIRSHVSSP